MTGALPRVVRMAATLLLAVCACDSEASDDTTSSTGGAAASGSSAGSGGGGGGAGGGTGSGGAPAMECAGRPNSTVPEGECDVFQQNCPQGTACEAVMLGGEWLTQCIEGSGLKGIKQTCAKHDECQAGLACLFGYCAPPCCPDTNEPCEGGMCNTVLDFGPYYVHFCSFLATCRIFTADACPAGEDCHILNDGTGTAVCVAPSDTPKMEGEACVYLNECGEMQVCWPPGSAASICRYHCSLEATTEPPGLGGCPAGQTCTDLGIAIEGVGVCQP